MNTIQEAALAFFNETVAWFLDRAEAEPRLTEVLYDGGPVVLDVGGDLLPCKARGLDDGKVMNLAQNAAVFSGQVFSREHPDLSVLIPPDWRVTFIRPPVVERPVMAMRKLRRVAVPLSRYVDDGIMTADEAAKLRKLVAAGKTIIVSGGVGSGKTTLLRTLLGLVPLSERIVSIEDPRELMLTDEDGIMKRRNWAAQEAVQGVRKMDALLHNALRLRPDRIIVGEVRGPEALELVRALNTGHRGGMFTLHSNGAHEALDRLHTLVVEAQPHFRFESVERAIDAVVQIDGKGERRRVVEIWERPGTGEERR